MARNKQAEAEEVEAGVAPVTLDPSELQFGGEPPATVRRGGMRQDAKAILAALQEHPGEWAKIVRDATTSTATRWRKFGLEVKMDRSGREEGDNRVDLWARYVPEAEGE